MLYFLDSIFDRFLIADLVFNKKSVFFSIPSWYTGLSIWWILILFYDDRLLIVLYRVCNIHVEFTFFIVICQDTQDILFRVQNAYVRDFGKRARKQPRHRSSKYECTLYYDPYWNVCGVRCRVSSISNLKSFLLVGPWGSSEAWNSQPLHHYDDGILYTYTPSSSHQRIIV